MITRRTLLLGIASIPLIGVPLANGISRIYNPSQVQITVDGIPIDGIPIDSFGYTTSSLGTYSIEEFRKVFSDAAGVSEELLFADAPKAEVET